MFGNMPITLTIRMLDWTTLNKSGKL